METLWGFRVQGEATERPSRYISGRSLWREQLSFARQMRRNHSVGTRRLSSSNQFWTTKISCCVSSVVPTSLSIRNR